MNGEYNRTAFNDYIPMNPNNMQISPKYKLAYLYEDDSLIRRLDVFEDRTKGWFFDHAKTLIQSKNQHVGFAVLKLVFSYFEMIAQYIEGASSDGHAEDSFKRGVGYVFPDIIGDGHEIQIKYTLWRSARNGLFHSGMTKGKLFIRDSESHTPIEFEDGKVYIDRFSFPSRIFEHFDSYINDLRTTTDATKIQNFNNIWEEVNRDKIYPIT
jgi:hypothetical protein